MCTINIRPLGCAEREPGDEVIGDKTRSAST